MSRLECRACERTFSDGMDAPWRCDCGHALDFTEQPIPMRPAPDPGSMDTRRGLWSFDEFLPVEQRVSLREGMTPLVEAPYVDAHVKLEYVFPSGSFKDRGAALTISRAVANDADRVLEDSSGNAGLAIATYAARAGLDATIYVPEDAPAGKRDAIASTGAEIVTVAGDRSEVTAACREAVEAGRGWYASHAWDPAFYAGTATAAYEIALQRDWSVPDAVVLPVGHGTLFLGMYRGFQTLVKAGWVDRVPRLYAGQAMGSAPLVDALHEETASDGSNVLADGIQIERPARLEQLLTAIDATEGDAVSVSTEEVRTELASLQERGFHTEPTCAVALAALATCRDRNLIGVDEDVVVPLTGSGLKT
jgi:threonine synthase